MAEVSDTLIILLASGSSTDHSPIANIRVINVLQISARQICLAQDQARSHRNPCTPTLRHNLHITSVDFVRKVLHHFACVRAAHEHATDVLPGRAIAAVQRGEVIDVLPGFVCSALRGHAHHLRHMSYIQSHPRFPCCLL